MKKLFFIISLLCHCPSVLLSLDDKPSTREIQHPGLSRYAACLTERYDTEVIAPTRYIGGKKVWNERNFALDAHQKPFFLFAREGEKSTIFSCDQSIITPVFIDKMDIIGNKENPGFVSCFVNEGMSLAGQAHLVALLTTPVCDSTVLKKRQDILKFFINNTALCTRIEGIASDLKKIEKYLIPLTEEKIDFGRFYLFDFLLLTRYNYHDYFCTKILSMMFNKDFSFLNCERLNKDSHELSVKWLLDMGVKIGSVPVSLMLHRTNKPKFFIYLSRLIALFALISAPFELFESPYPYICSVSKKLACFLNDLKSLATIMQNERDIFQLYSSLEPLLAFSSKNQSDNLARTMRLASHTSVRTGYVSPVLHRGRPIALWNNIRLAHRDIRAALHVFGQLEAYARIARVYCAHQATSLSYCFVDYPSSADTPFL